jgi:hypothetical protein
MVRWIWTFAFNIIIPRFIIIILRLEWQFVEFDIIDRFKTCGSESLDETLQIVPVKDAGGREWNIIVCRQGDFTAMEEGCVHGEIRSPCRNAEKSKRIRVVVEVVNYISILLNLFVIQTPKEDKK